MYKSKLQELCHQNSWRLPEYSHAKEGPDHVSRFIGSVTVNGATFHTSSSFSSTKQALNEAAKVAYVRFCDPQPSLSLSKVSSPVSETSDSGTSCGSKQLDSDRFQSTNNNASGTPGSNLLNTNVVEVNPSMRDINDTTQSIDGAKGSAGTSCCSKQLDSDRFQSTNNNASASPGSNLLNPNIVEINPSMRDINDTTQSIDGEKGSAVLPSVEFMYKSQLSVFAQKKSFSQVTYSHDRVGPPHNARFKAKVTVNGQTFESPGLFRTVKEAEHAAAKDALFSLSGNEEDDVIQYKNLLRGLCLKQGFGLPIYYTNASHASKNGFVCEVMINEEKFQGNEGKNKKQAESNAAKEAYNILSGRKPGLVRPSSHGHENFIALRDPITGSSGDCCKNVDVEEKSEPSNEALDCPSTPTGSGECSQNVTGVKDADAIIKEAFDSPSMTADPEECSKNVATVSESATINKGSEPWTTAPLERSRPISSQSSQKTAQIRGKSSYIGFKKVMVFPRNADTPLPPWAAGGSIHPISNDEWVAVTMDSMPVNN